MSHLLLLGVIVLLFGGKRIPDAAAGLGRGIREFKNALNGGDSPDPKGGGILSSKE